MPSQLSGGMVKRAALARAIVMDPKLLFFDEPSAGLDPVVSAELDELILRLRDALRMTIVVVTHELESAFKIADTITVLDQGEILMTGTVAAVRAADNRAHSGSLEPASARDPCRRRCVPEATHRGGGLIESASRSVARTPRAWARGSDVRRDTVNYTLVGAVVLAAIVLLLVGLALITGRSGASTGYVVRYRNVTGLRYGAPVFYQGYRIGQVSGITPERDRGRHALQGRSRHPCATGRFRKTAPRICSRRDCSPTCPSASAKAAAGNAAARRRAQRHRGRRHLRRDERARRPDHRAHAQPDHAVDPHAVATRRLDHRRDRQDDAADSGADARAARRG